jgi:hypothetical protein
MKHSASLRLFIPLLLVALALAAVIAVQPAQVRGEPFRQMRTPTPTVIPFDERELSSGGAVEGRAQALPTLNEQLCFRLIDGALPIRTRAEASARTIGSLTSETAFQVASILLVNGDTWLNILITIEMASIQGWIQADGAAVAFELCGVSAG